MADADIKIKALPQTDPNKCDFVVEHVLEPYGAYNITRGGDVTGSSLATEIFSVPQVNAILVIGQTITATKSEDNAWTEIGKEIGAAIRRAINSGKPLIGEKLKTRSPSEQQLLRNVMQIIQDKINPAIASHGGFIDLIDVSGRDLFIRMGGGCQGCASSAATLRQGVEQAFREAIPDLGLLHDTTDHAAGQNPYYTNQAQH